MTRLTLAALAAFLVSTPALSDAMTFGAFVGKAEACGFTIDEEAVFEVLDRYNLITPQGLEDYDLGYRFAEYSFEVASLNCRIVKIAATKYSLIKDNSQ